MFVTRMDAVMEVGEKADRENTGVLSCVAMVELFSQLIFSIFVDDVTRPGELAIDDNPANVVWPLKCCVLLILFTFVVEYDSVLSDTRLSATSGELL